MSAKPVDWVLVVRFGSTAHRATYGRLSGSTLYSKDYIQLSRKQGFIEDLIAAFPELQGDDATLPITYSWPTGSAPGKLVRQSADRPHLTWVTDTPPPPWKMSENPSSLTAETIKGNPSHDREAAAESEFNQLVSSGFGQPFLIAAKLKDESATLHLRVHVQNPDPKFGWTDLQNAPPEVQALAATTSNSSALAWRLFADDGDASTLFFDPDSKANPWKTQPSSWGEQEGGTQHLSADAETSQASNLDSDFTAETLPHTEKEVSEFERKLEEGDYAVPDSTATVKTRGSAQRAFAEKVKNNYGWRCAMTGIRTREFLIASHIVSWSADETIRLDPANGICLSVLVDRAFENGFLVVEDDLSVAVDWNKVGDDAALKEQLARFDGPKLRAPKAYPPKVEYLRRRRAP